VSRPDLPQGPCLVVGLARSGAAVARLLSGLYPKVYACDSGQVDQQLCAELEQLGVEVHPLSSGIELISKVATVVKSPGVPNSAEVISAALNEDREVLGEFEVAWRTTENRVVGVTGTNGKTTTVQLLDKIFKVAKVPAQICGNVGIPIGTVASKTAPDETLICEVSSFQLADSTHFAPDIGVLLNLASDHIDRHGSLQAYHEAKLSMLTHQPEGSYSVLGEQFITADLDLKSEKVFFGTSSECHMRSMEGQLLWNGQSLTALEDVALTGRHNLDNAMAGATAALLAGVSESAVVEALSTFKGVSHRFELVAEVEGVRYIDDSKATNVASVVAALQPIEGGVRLILGGSDKGERFTELKEVVEQACSAVYLIGETSSAIIDDFGSTQTPLNLCNDLEQAFAAASAEAESGETVLLSPACASFDQYSSYEQRGEHFHELVKRIASGKSS